MQIHKNITEKLSRASRYSRTIMSLQALALLLFGQSAHADKQLKSAAGEKRETELRLVLTADGFTLLQKKFESKADKTQRIDMYFDIFDGQFLLRRNQPRAKLRIQQRADEFVSQKSWLLEQHSTETQGFVWSASTRVSISEKFSPKSKTAERYTGTRVVLEALSAGTLPAPRALAWLTAQWKPQSWASLEDFDHGTSNMRGQFIPAAVVLKERWIVPVTMANGKTLKIQIGRDSDRVKTDQPQSYELEVEVKNSSIAEEQEMTEFLSQFLAEQGLRGEHTTNTKTYDFFNTLENLFASGEDSLEAAGSL